MCINCDLVCVLVIVCVVIIIRVSLHDAPAKGGGGCTCGYIFETKMRVMEAGLNGFCQSTSASMEIECTW